MRWVQPVGLSSASPAEMCSLLLWVWGYKLTMTAKTVRSVSKEPKDGCRGRREGGWKVRYGGKGESLHPFLKDGDACVTLVMKLSPLSLLDARADFQACTSTASGALQSRQKRCNQKGGNRGGCIHPHLNPQATPLVGIEGGGWVGEERRIGNKGTSQRSCSPRDLLFQLHVVPVR